MPTPYTLPSTTFITKDGTLTFTAPPPTGDTIMVIGQALDGPVGIPQVITNFTDLEAAFGPLVYTPAYPSPDGDSGKLGTFSGNTLVKGVREVIMGGGSSILLVRVGGQTAASATPIFNGSTAVSGLYPGSVYNGASLSYTATAASGTTVTCAQPAAKGGAFSISFTPQTSFEAICVAINTDPRNGTFNLVPGIAATTGNATLNGWTGAQTVTLTGGTNGTIRDDYAGVTKQALYNDFVKDGGFFDMIRGTPANIVYVNGIYADDCVVDPAGAASGSASLTSFATDLARFCYTESRDSFPMIGLIGLSPLRANDNASVAGRVAALTGTQTTFADAQAYKLSMGQFLQAGMPFTDSSTGQTVDAGGYLSVVAGPDLVIPDNRLGQYAETPAGVLAGMLAGLNPQQGLTNQALPPSTRLAYRFSRTQRNLLNAGVGNTGASNQAGGGAYVTLYYQSLVPAQPKLVVTSDVTAGARTSTFAQTQTLRIVQAAEDVIEYVGQQFLGSPNNTATITALDSQIQRGLDAMAEAGALNGGKGSGYVYQILTAANSISTLGQISIILQLRPAFEIRQITTTVSVTQ